MIIFISRITRVTAKYVIVYLTVGIFKRNISYCYRNICSTTVIRSYDQYPESMSSRFSASVFLENLQ